VIFSLDDLLILDIFDSPERSGAYLGKQPGVIAPVFEWSLTEVDLPFAEQSVSFS